MLVSNERFDDIAVMSLQTGSQLARTARAIISPYNLKILAFELEGPLLHQSPSLLRIEDIREIGPLGIIIDSVDELISLSDVIKIKEIYELNFNLIGLKVVDDKKHNTGKVSGYTLEAESFVIQQLLVKRPFLQSMGDTELLIHRSQIIKITNTLITVESPTIRKTQAISAPMTAIDNPFRSTQTTQLDTTTTQQ